MDQLIYFSLIFLTSCIGFYFAGELILKNLIHIAKALGWKEFVVSFLVISIIGSLPNLFVGVTAALYGTPELSFGDVIGGNVVDLTLSVALAALFSVKGIPAKSKTIQNTLIFTLMAIIMPVALAFDGMISRLDGVFLIMIYVAYIVWLFSKKERFSKTCEESDPQKRKIALSFPSFAKILLAIVIFVLASIGVVDSANYFAMHLGIPLIMIGLFILGIGNCAPEIYFAISCAKKGNDWMILGDLIGALIVPATLVIGTVALIHPIDLTGSMASLEIARVFLVISVALFVWFARNDQVISKKEAMILLFIYISFITIEIFANKLIG
ncbi:MAG: calcium/sodium antiporter [Minisyncoccus archaeiphilus]|uniref:sodium:calcium antiporter n=1 Tax=Minisyncoccus archaeiphilus TaxID=3238481 RepID=UPI002B109D2E|nr:MAG: calcium/sodium antiporter [Candidatus Parcubacteria bacterium]